MQIAIFGLGYVGAVTAAGLASRGHRVVGVDVEPSKVTAINAGRAPVAEPGLDALMRTAVEAGLLTATTQATVALDGADISLICVGTPSSAGGAADLTFLTRCLDDIAEALRTVSPPSSGRHALIVRSTVPPGTVENIVAPRAAAMSTSQWSVGTGMCPEFLREGSGVDDFFGPSLAVLGTTDADVANTVQQVFAFLDVPVQVVPPRTAEALKYACNAFHATKVSFANEMGRVLRPLEVDARQVMALLCEDTVLNISPYYLRPGFAYGGSCLPKDLRSLVDLARRHSIDAPLLIGTASTNDLILREVVDRVIAHHPRSIALLGLSFKSDTDDLRESPYVEVAERLVGKGFELRVYDPVLNPDRLVGANKTHVESRLPHIRRLLCRTPAEALEGVDLALVSTADAQTVESLVSAPPPVVMDLQGRLGERVEALAGYEGVGW
jgi:GDP-mannose 6-dehydrogenase